MKIQQRKEVRITYYITCPKCKKEIKGGSPSAAKYNLKKHQGKERKELQKERGN